MWLTQAGPWTWDTRDSRGQADASRDNAVDVGWHPSQGLAEHRAETGWGEGGTWPQPGHTHVTPWSPTLHPPPQVSSR